MLINTISRLAAYFSCELCRKGEPANAARRIWRIIQCRNHHHRHRHQLRILVVALRRTFFVNKIFFDVCTHSNCVKLNFYISIEEILRFFLREIQCLELNSLVGAALSSASPSGRREGVRSDSERLPSKSRIKRRRKTIFSARDAHRFPRAGFHLCASYI